MKTPYSWIGRLIDSMSSLSKSDPIFYNKNWQADLKFIWELTQLTITKIIVEKSKVRKLKIPDITTINYCD